MIRKISREQAQAKLSRMIEAVFPIPVSERLIPLDVRRFDEAEVQLLPHAILIPAPEIEHRAKAILTEPGAEILVYGSRAHPEDVKSSAQMLEAMGYENLYVYEEGIEDWLAAGLNTETRLPQRAA